MLVRSMKILVTGGSGFIGSAFVRMIIAGTDWQVINLDKSIESASKFFAHHGFYEKIGQYEMTMRM